ncbi:MFS transporter [Staphylococcus equorum]|uniref:MFS transporter n=1 Tax=Staphylococcus equorum TaxID=246432 RepID=UPI000D1CE34D|nr:MFS transporter [Staphylococcus equorum]PTE84206.1 MFS transporter [Staphylococcus equorum]PTF10938.1 MFS transporter [Staphylococcus equorum]
MNKKLVLFIVLGSYFLIMMDTSITMTALNEIQDDLDMSEGLLTWVQSAYVLIFGGLLLLGSKMGDILGLKKIFLIGLSLFLLFSIATGLATNSLMLIISRGGQGIGAALVSPSILAFINSIYEDGPEKRKAISLYSAIAGIGASGGLIVGGVLTSLISWRLCFLINIPICIIFIALALIQLPKMNSGKQQSIDIIGALLSIVSVILIILGMERMNTSISLESILLILIGVVLLIVFIIIENRMHSPIIDLNLFKNKIRSSGYLLRFLFLSTSFSFWYYMSLYFQNTFGLTPFATGLLLILTTGFNFIVALNIHKLLEKTTNIAILVRGIVISIIGMGLLSLCLYYQTKILFFIIPLVLIGVGQGFIFTPLTNLGVHKVSNENSGVASGLVNLSHQIGSSAGIVFQLLIGTFIINYTSVVNNNNTFTFITIIIGTLIQLFMLIYVMIIFKKNNYKYEI